MSKTKEVKVIKKSTNIVAIGFFPALTLMLILLKILGYNVTWGWIICAFFGPVILVGILCIAALAFIMAVFAVFMSVEYFEAKESKKRWADRNIMR